MKQPSVMGDFLRTYCNPKMRLRFFVGFSCGIPFLLTLTILDLWLKDIGVSNTAIGLFTLLHWPFTLKFLWAPFIDKLNFPYFSKKLGRLRGWVLASQMLLFVGLIGMSCTNPQSSLPLLMFFTSLVAFADGCQDMSLYSYQMDRTKSDSLGHIAGIVLFGYRGGMLFAKSATLYLAHYFGWNIAYAVMAFSIFLCTILIIVAKEPICTQTKKDEITIDRMVRSYDKADKSRIEFTRFIKRTMFECLVCPFVVFMKKNSDWRCIIALLMLFRAGDIVAQKMAKPFYIDLGFSLLQIANVVQVFGTVAALVGSLVGGYLVKKNSIMPAMLYTGTVHALSCFAYVALCQTGPNTFMLYFTVFIENISGGAMGAAFIAFLYNICDRRYCATQYALLWAFYDLGGIAFRIMSGALADMLGWTNFFLFIPLLFLPSLGLLYSMIAREYINR
ncbi:MAG: MFS transporter [Holosporaceae bacterium]|jgi:PAT family beta-lactamase induction signal transducer AmpG|nr:MFS transporter [Holosporaceae bacterium]